MKHSDYLKKKKTRETRKKIISVISAIVVFITTYALVLPAITLDVSKASQEPGIAYEQMQFKATAAAASVTAADSTVEEARVEEPAAEEPEEELAEEIKEEEPAETPEEETSAVSAEEEEEEEAIEEAPAEPEQEEAPAQEPAETAEPQEEKSEADQNAAESSSESAPAEAETADTQKAAEDAAVDQSSTAVTDAAAAATTAEAAAEFKVPELDALDFDDILTGKTNFYYYHVENAEEAEEISSDSIDDWKKVNSDTVLAPEDFVRVYLSYEIPAGALNETNAVARYKLPAGLELSDKQIKAINKYENGIAASKSGSERDKYLGAEAIEGSRTPDEKADDEYISATVKVKKTDNDRQELVFTFIPYTVEKNQISYDDKGEVKSKGKEVKGFFTFDLKTSQIDFEKTNIETVEKEDGTSEEIQYSQAKVVFADKDSNWIERALTLAAPVEKDETQVAGLKTLTSEGPDYTVTVSYTDEAQIPDNAVLKVSEIGKDTPEYEAYLEQAKGAVGDENKSVNEARFFDITILVDGEKVEPQAPVSVQINFAGIEQTNTDDTQLLHYKDSEDVEVMDQAEFSKSEEQAVDTVQFETDGFSVYGIVGTGAITVPFVAGDGSTYEVTVNFGKDAGIPEGAQLEVTEVTESSDKYDEYVEQAADAIDSRAIDLNYIKLLDIKILDENGNKVTLNAPVDVQIRLLDKEQAENNTQVVHFEGDDEKPVVVDSLVEGDAVSFSTDGFSIYAVVDSGSTDVNARMTLHFVVNGTEIAHMFVKNADTLTDLETIIYDPGTGDTNNLIFKGWSLVENYTVEDADTKWTAGADRGAMDIGDVRTWAEAKTIQEFEDAYVYAMLYDTYDVMFFDEDNAIVHSDLLLFKANDTSGVEYTIDVPYEPKGQDFKFNGWYKDSGSTIEPNMTPYPNETTVTIKSDVMFSANPDEGHWLVFKENGSGASYTPPQFVLKNATPTRPTTNPTRNGYDFAGWYTDAAGTTEFNFNQTLTQRTEVYAKWTVHNPAEYTVIIWQQQTTGNEYDFVTSIHLTGTANTNVNSVSQQGTGNGAYARINGTNYQYTGFHLKEYTQNVNINPEGTAVVNVYYDRNEYTFQFYVANPDTTNYYSHNSNNQLYTIANNNNRQKIYTITKRYGENISDIWNFTGTDGQSYPRKRTLGTGYNAHEVITSWQPIGSSTYTARITHMETMPAENLNFNIIYSYRPKRHFHYYVEALPGSSNTRTFNGKQYVPYVEDLEHDFQIVVYNDDFWELDGFTREAIATANGTDVTSTIRNAGTSGVGWQNGWNSNLYFYYTRDKNKIVYNDGKFVDGNGASIADAPPARTAMHESQDILYGASVADQVNEYTPTLTGYVLEGWYLNKECAGNKFDFSTATMPKGGIQLYAKWVQVQYRVFLHANAKIEGENDPSLDWGGQEMSFRVNYNDQLAGGNTIKGTRDDYELIGWYFDEALTQPFNIASYYLNDSTVTDTYDKTRPTELDKWSDPTEPTNKDATNNRYWITRSLDLYAKWRAKLEGANGINVIYDATDKGYMLNNGTPVQYLEDTLIYKDSSAASAKGASTPNEPTADEEELQFMYWEVCKWTGADETTSDDYSGFVETGQKIYPGNDFTVLKSNARLSDVERVAKVDEVGNPITDEQGNPVFEIESAKYSVLLRAVYGPKGTPTPTHITWYANNGTGDTVTDANLQINEAVDIRKPVSPFTREGYKFLGWARKVEVSNEEGNVVTIDGVSPTNLDKTYTEEDLFLKWDGTKFVATALTYDGANVGNEVKKIAADESDPYHGMVAVWESNKYKVTIKKEVEGIVTDQYFTIGYNFDDDELEDGDVSLQHSGQEQLNIDVPYGTSVSISESAEGYDKTFSAALTSGGEGVEPETVNEGQFKIKGDTTITVTNTRQKGNLEISKATDPTGIADSQIFKVSVKNSDNKYLQSTSDISFGDEVVWLDVSVNSKLTINDLPTDTYTVEEDPSFINVEGYRYDGVSFTLTNGSVPVVKNETASLTITNSYTKLVSVTVTKILNDKYPEGSTSFTFTPVLTENGVDITSQYITDLTDEKFTLTPSGDGETKTESVTFENLPVGAVLSITETADNKYSTTIKVNGTAADVANLTIADTDEGNAIEFTNTRKTYSVDFKKIAADGTPLNDAEFSLKISNGSTYVNYPDGNLTIGTGTLSLVPGSYELTENKSPDGYVILTNTIRFSVDVDGNLTDPTKEDGTADANLAIKQDGTTQGSVGTIVVKNTPGHPLPHTGGSGTLLYTLSGIVLMLGAALMYGFRMRRRERRLN